VLDVYLPALLLQPEVSWLISGQLTFSSTAILPIAAFLLIRPRQRWEWSSADFLVIAFPSMRAFAEKKRKISVWRPSEAVAHENAISMQMPSKV
jgi:hypothetical protein